MAIEANHLVHCVWGEPGTEASILLGKPNFHYINGLNNAYEMTITYVCTRKTLYLRNHKHVQLPQKVTNSGSMRVDFQPEKELSYMICYYIWLSLKYTQVVSSIMLICGPLLCWYGQTRHVGPRHVLSDSKRTGRRQDSCFGMIIVIT